MRILHLSGTHLPIDDGGDGDGVDARLALKQLLYDCRHLLELDAVVLSGDVADDGSDAAYRDAFTLISDYAVSKAQPRSSACATTTNGLPAKPF